MKAQKGSYCVFQSLIGKIIEVLLIILVLVVAILFQSLIGKIIVDYFTT